jgi:tetratricopeptide (TPR) repeat protein
MNLKFDLKVNYLLEGSTQRYEDQVRIRIQLIHSSTDNHIWGDIFEGEWKDIFDIQINVAKQVARELKTVLSPKEVQRIENKSTENIEAYNLYLQGRYFWNQHGRDDLDKSIEYYKRALEIDPNYALAYSGMAATYTSYAWGGYLPRRDVMPQAKTAALKALEIDNTLGEAHAELAWARVVHDWDWTGGEKGFKRALELNSNNARAHNGYAWLLTFVGRLDEAIEESKRAHELDPLHLGMWVHFGWRYYYARDYDRAIEEYRKVIEIFPNDGWVRTHLALALLQKGFHNEAIEEYSKNEFMLRNSWHLGYIYGVAGKKEKALEILNYYLELSKKEFVAPFIIVNIYIGLGEKDKAFEWLEKIYEQREARLDLLQVDPIYDSLRSDPRFQDLVERMNFPD